MFTNDRILMLVSVIIRREKRVCIASQSLDSYRMVDGDSVIYQKNTRTY